MYTLTYIAIFRNHIANAIFFYKKNIYKKYALYFLFIILFLFFYNDY